MEPIRNHRNKMVVEAAKLHRAKERQRRGLSILEGPHLIADVRRAGGSIEQEFTTDPAEPGLTVDRRAMRRLAGTKSPRGPVAVVRIPTETLDQGRHVVVAVGISDPGNLGAIVRTAASFNWGFAYVKGTADPWSPKSLRAGAGGQFQTTVGCVDSISDLDGWTKVSTVVKGGLEPAAIKGGPFALLVGEEAHGLDSQVLEASDTLLTIPTDGTTESLNAAVATGIAVYALSKHGKAGNRQV